MYVQFTSQDPNGLVAYSEGPGDAFFMLLLRNSLLQFVFSCGLQTVSFLQGNDKLTRNYQTDVSVRWVLARGAAREWCAPRGKDRCIYVCVRVPLFSLSKFMLIKGRESGLGFM